MAENNNNTFTVTITPKTFNGIITGNGDGIYNVAYTSLTKDQIDEIGKQFADRLSDEESGLKKIARTGEYKDLEKKPGIPNGYTQESTFNKIAFSGNYNDLNPASRPALTNWPNTKPAFHEVAFNGDYTKLSNTPNLNVSDNNSSITGLANVAISGNYGDLNGTPALATIATSGNYNDLNYKPFISINLTEFNNSNVSESINNQLKDLGNSNISILDCGNFKDTHNNNLIAVFEDKIIQFLSLKIGIFQIITDSNIFYIQNIDYYPNIGNNNPNYYILTTSIQDQSNYNTIYEDDVITQEQADQKLNNLSNIGHYNIIIIDIVNKIIFNKIISI